MNQQILGAQKDFVAQDTAYGISLFEFAYCLRRIYALSFGLEIWRVRPLLSRPQQPGTKHRIEQQTMESRV